jgi:hypothetical protein
LPRIIWIVVKIIVGIFLLSVVFPFRFAMANSAVFSKDEAIVYLINNQNRLVQFEFASAKFSEPVLPKEIHQGKISGLGRSNAGFVLILQGDDLLAYDPATQNAPLIFSFAKKLASDGKLQKWTPEEFAYNPADGSILFYTTAGDARTLWFLPKDEEHPKPVFVRRVDYLVGMSFSETGQLFFGFRGDLWCGSIASDPDGAGGEPPEHIYYLDAIRIAPIATLETDEATPSTQGVRVTAAGKDRIYLHSARLGGSGFGTILSVIAPDSKVGTVSPDTNAGEDRSYFDLDKRLILYSTELNSALFYGENGGESLLCISPSGQKIFYRGSSKGSEETAFFLIEGNQPPKKIADDLK